MPFVPPRAPALPPRPGRSTGPVLSVGRRVFVNCPGNLRGRVMLMDEAGRAATSSLVDGTEVEIVAWRPRGAGGTRYRVHTTHDDLDGWLPADNLRPTPGPAPERAEPAPRSTVAPASGDGGRKFGQRR